MHKRRAQPLPVPRSPCSELAAQLGVVSSLRGLCAALSLPATGSWVTPATRLQVPWTNWRPNASGLRTGGGASKLTHEVLKRSSLYHMPSAPSPAVSSPQEGRLTSPGCGRPSLECQLTNSRSGQHPPPPKAG